MLVSFPSSLFRVRRQKNVLYPRNIFLITKIMYMYKICDLIGLNIDVRKFYDCISMDISNHLYILYNFNAFVFFLKLHPSQGASLIQVGAFPVSASFFHCCDASYFRGYIFHEKAWSELCTLSRAVHTPIT